MSQESEQAQDLDESWIIRAIVRNETFSQASAYEGGIRDYKAAIKAEIEKRIKESMTSQEDDFSTEEWFLSLIDTVTPISNAS